MVWTTEVFKYHFHEHRIKYLIHYHDVIMSSLASQITSLTIVYSIVYSDVDQRKHQSSASLAFVRGIHRGPVNFPHKWPVTQKMFPFDDVIMFMHLRTITWCRHDMGTPSVLLTICERNPPVSSRRYRNAEFLCFRAVGLNKLSDKQTS